VKICTTSVVSVHIRRPSPSDNRVGFSNSFTRLRLGSLAWRPALLLFGNSRPRVTATPLPHATGAYGQLPGRDLNPLDLLRLLRTLRSCFLLAKKTRPDPNIHTYSQKWPPYSRRTPTNALDEAAQGQGSWNRQWTFPDSAALCEIWAIQGSNNGGLEIGACLGVKNIGKPYALIAHVRFDAGGQARACSLLYPAEKTKGFIREISV